MNLYRTAAVVTLFSAAEHCLGFLYRIILSRTIGPEGLGVYQAAYSVFAVFLTLSASGLPVTLSRVISRHRAHGNRPREHAAVTGGVLITLAFSVPAAVLLFLLRTPFSKVFADPRCADLFYILIAGLPCTCVYSVIRGSFWGNKRFFAYSFIELVEEMIRIGVGVVLLLTVTAGVYGANLAAVAVLISYLCSFAIALVWFFLTGGRLRSPRGELRPLLASSLPVTAIRTSSSLLSSLISVLFPLRMQAAGATSARAMREYGVVCGMVMPVMAIPCAFIGSIALVLVPELSENYYRGRQKEVRALTARALKASLLVSCALVPFYLVCGEDVGVLLYSNAVLTELSDQVAEATERHELLLDENERLQTSIESRMSLRNIEDVAKNELGLAELEPYQVTYVNRSAGDKIVTTASTPSQTSILEGIADTIGSALEYLRISFNKN